MNDQRPVTEEVECPLCSADVAGCFESFGGDGLRRFTQPTKRVTRTDGSAAIQGGFVHIEGGRRCLSDAEGR